MGKAKSSPPPQSDGMPRAQPERKIALAGGIGVAIWVNTTDSDAGQRQFRSVTITPRRYQDRETGEWKDAKSFNAGDLPALIFALTKAQEFCFETPLPGNGNQHHEEPPY